MKTTELQTISKVYDMLSKGMTNPILINQAYSYIQTIQGMDVPMHVKEKAITRFMMFNYADEIARASAENNEIIADTDKDNDLTTLPEDFTIGSVDNQPFQTHAEDVNTPVQNIEYDVNAGTDSFELDLEDDINQFLTKDEKAGLKQNKSGTELKIVKSKPRGRRPRK